MKNITIALLLTICFSVAIKAQTPDERIGTLLNETDYFELSKQFLQYKDSIHPALAALSQSVLDDALNKPAEACKSIEYLAENYHEELGLDNIMSMVTMLAQNRMKLGEYNEAAELLEKYIEDSVVIERLNANVLQAMKNTHARIYPLKNLAKPQIERPERDCSVAMTFDLENNTPYVNVKINGNETSFILDTGADAPLFISKDFAHKNGFKILGDSILTSGLITQAYTNVASVDSIMIGDIIYRNVWAIVASDTVITYNDSVIAHIDPVLGRWFMDAIGEFHILPYKKEIVFPAQFTAQTEDVGNMIIVNGQPYVETYSNGESLAFHFDTGNGGKNITLNSNYYNSDREEIEATYKADSIGIGGFGGARRIATYILPEFSFHLGGVNSKFENVSILTEELETGNKGVGVLGSYYVSRFDRVIVNFKDMFVKVE